MNSINVCGHIVEENEIIGIGPLKVNTPTDPQARAYNARGLNFDLHCRFHTFEIRSALFLIQDGKSEAAAEVLKFENYREEYERAKLLIIEFLKKRM